MLTIHAGQFEEIKVERKRNYKTFKAQEEYIYTHIHTLDTY